MSLLAEVSAISGPTRSRGHRLGGVLVCAFLALSPALLTAQNKEDPPAELLTNSPETGPCVITSTTLCLNGRFAVSVTYIAATARGNGAPALITGDTGYFWFFSWTNVEVVVKVVDGRAFNNRFWVFAGGLTDVECTITVVDTQTGVIKTYHNPANTPFLPIQDTVAF